MLDRAEEQRLIDEWIARNGVKKYPIGESAFYPGTNEQVEPKLRGLVRESSLAQLLECDQQRIRFAVKARGLPIAALTRSGGGMIRYYTREVAERITEIIRPKRKTA